MRKIILFVVLMITFWACADKKPKNLLSQSDMTDLLYELVLIGAIESSSYQQDTIYITQTPEDLLKKYELDSLGFVEQHRYYLRHEPQVYAEMLDTIQNKFRQKAEELGGTKPDTEKTKKILKSTIKRDSLTSKVGE